MTHSSAASPRVYLMLIVGVLAASSGAILITYALQEGIPSSVIAAGRMSIAALLLTPFVLRRQGDHRAQLRALSRADLLLGAGAGFWLAVHFATWIASLEYTSVLISVVMVSTGPLWVALLEFLLLRVLPRPLVIVGLIVAIGGGIVIGLAGDPAAGEANTASTGALLALAGAVSFALYLVTGRRVRAKLSLLPYIWLVYSIAAAFLVLLAVLNGATFTGYSPAGYGLIALLALAPQLIGHTSFNYALRYLNATYISIATQMEPIFSAIAAALLFGQVPRGLQIVGSALVLIGVLLATLGQRSAPPAGATQPQSKPQ
ncbi:MAG: DMT family transporter [Anaerolineae bacterium]|nr:DMT family transporter [Anaerolineae bacterium]NUQ05042.1 DMT family transporter [Anaerolineae bacterium]